MKPSWSTVTPRQYRRTNDTSDRLYFEPLTEEDVLELVNAEQQNGNLKGVIVQLGGQTPLKLAKILQDEGIPILGTDPRCN